MVGKPARSKKQASLPDVKFEVKPNEPVMQVVMKRQLPRYGASPLKPGMVATFRKEAAERMVRKGQAVPYTPSKIDLRDAVVAVKEAGGVIECEGNNQQLAGILSELAAKG